MMNIKNISRKITSQVIDDLVSRGAKVGIIFYDYPHFIIEAKWPTGRLWQIEVIQ